MTLHVGGIDVVLNNALLAGLQETTLVLNLQEQFPAFLCQSIRQVLYVVRTG